MYKKIAASMLKPQFRNIYWVSKEPSQDIKLYCLISTLCAIKYKNQSGNKAQH